MRRLVTAGMLIPVLVITLLAAGSCSSGIPQEQYDEVNDALMAVQSQLDSLTGDVEELSDENEELSQQYDAAVSELAAVKSDYEELSQQKDAMMSQIEELQAENEALRSEYDAATEEAGEVAAEDVEKALFDLINQDRVNNGLSELIWGENLYKTAIGNSRTMATSQRLAEPEQASYKEAIWATGYNTADSMAGAVFTIWENGYSYEIDFLNTTITHGAVGVYKSGDIYYITYVSSIWA